MVRWKYLYTGKQLSLGIFQQTLGPQKPFDKRSFAGRRRKLAQQKSTDTMMELIDTAKASGLSADYVLPNCWFANPAQIISVKNRGMDTIAMIKKSSRIHYEYQGEQLNIKQIYSRNKKRCGVQSTFSL